MFSRRKIEKRRYRQAALHFGLMYTLSLCLDFQDSLRLENNEFLEIATGVTHLWHVTKLFLESEFQDRENKQTKEKHEFTAKFCMFVSVSVWQQRIQKIKLLKQNKKKKKKKKHK